MESKSQIQQSIVSSLPSKPHGILLLSPRIGKTKIMIDIIKREKPKKILWITPNENLRDVEIPNEFITWKAKTYLNKTTIVCWASLSKVKGNYDVVVCDEYQYITEGNSKPFFNGKIKYNYMIGLSGTEPKGLDKQEILGKLGLTVLNSMTIDEAVSKDLVADYSIKVILTKLESKEKTIKAGSKDKPFMQTESNAYSYITKRINSIRFSGKKVPDFMYIQRMHLIKNLESKKKIAKKLISTLPGRTLVFAGSINQAEELSEHTHHSKNKANSKLKDFIDGKVPVLACVESGGVGTTYRGVDNFIITQVNSNQNGSTTQKIARSLVPQEGYKATIYLIVADDTVDVGWTMKALEDFNPDKVEWLSAKNYE